MTTGIFFGVALLKTDTFGWITVGGAANFIASTFVFAHSAAIHTDRSEVWTKTDAKHGGRSAEVSMIAL
jgi:hypothetical protein